MHQLGKLLQPRQPPHGVPHPLRGYHVVYRGPLERGKVSKRRYSKFDAAGHLGVSMSTIRRMIQRGELETERDGPKPNGKVWVLLDDYPGTPEDVPSDPPAGSDSTPSAPSANQTNVSGDAASGQLGTPGTPADGTPFTPYGVPADLATGSSGIPDGMPGSPAGVPDAQPSGVPDTPEGTPDLVTEVAVLRQQVRHMEELGTYREERLKELEKLAQDRADLLKNAEWRYHELVKQVTSTMEHVTRALPAANGAEGKAIKRSWWPFRRRSTAGS